MKTSVLFAFTITLLMIPILLHGQTKISFQYDAAGNRIYRRVIDMGKTVCAMPDSATINPLSDQIDQVRISIYPNPTKGIITVDMANPPSDKQITCAIFNSEGKRLHFSDSPFQSDKIDLSSYPNGIYVLVITVDNKKSEWKIIKE